ncbi:MAG: hypothetical protein IKJ01_02950 [Lachnospiraceae bacterium]|nr:hypothetical protein [Lachnospiraceae bacterium]
MKNIFIEGIQGMGKSTLLNRIFTVLPQLHICREGDYSPVELAWCTWMTKEEYDAILKQYNTLQDEIIKNTVQEDNHFIISYTKIITDVPNFHKELEKFEIYNGRKTLQEFKEIIFTRYKNFTETDYLLECSFFQNIIEELILFYQLSDDEIVTFYYELYSKIDKEHFLLLYLYSDKLEESIAIIKKERSDSMGNEMWYPMMLKYLIDSPYGKSYGYRTLEDMITHFQHRQQLELRIIKEVIDNKAVILTAKEWKIEDIIKLIK